ncbi:MAG: hypothetical protein ACYTGP_01195 [Planctomycetota bacterium]|jgi:hypothetical protein
MATETPRTDKTAAAKKAPPIPDFLGMWDATVKAQRQWLGAFSQPFGFEMTPEKWWKHWQMFNAECLDQTEQSFTRMKDFVTDEVRFARDFSDKAVDMAKARAKDAPPTVEPEFTREWFDTSRRCLERSFRFNTESMKAAEEFGLKVSEMLVKEPIAKGS